MADVHEPAVRSYNMSRVKGKNTKPELLVRKWLYAQGYRYRLHGRYQGKTLPGKPDIVLAKYKTVVFVHGCFWHAHEGCKYFSIPKTRTEWWTEKLMGNRERDIKHQMELEAMGWKVIVVWECEINSLNLNNLCLSLPKIKA
ncbi:DNA mismatch endonuclease Vsr [bacterium]|nr:DNA mismatch endonuclease Vsr [bacterium]